MAKPPEPAGATSRSSLGGLDTQAQIDDKITELQQTIFNLQAQISTLRTQRNALSTISRLPSELLSTIFVHHARIYHRDLSFPEPGAPQSVSVSYVCRHWRDVALNCTDMWGYIDNAPRRWIKVFLSRSKHALRRINFTWAREHRERPSQLRTLLHRTERISDIKLWFPDTDYMTVFSMFSSPAPFLQSLVIKVDNQRNNPMDPVTLPLFSGVIPALRQLELYRCPMPRLTPMLGNLTTLILHDSSQSIPELATALHAMPSLVHLELCRVLGGLRTHSSNAMGPGDLRFPHLQRLVLEDTLPCVTRFLACLNFPSKAEVRILGSQVYSQGEWLSFRSILREKIFASRDCLTPPIRTLGIDRAVSESTVFSFSSENTDWSSDYSDYFRFLGRNIPLSIVFHHGKPNAIQEIVQDAYSNGFLSGLRSAYIHLRSSFPEPHAETRCSSFYQDIFCSTPELQYIQLTPAEANTSDTISDLCDALNIRKENGYTLNQLVLKGHDVSKEDVTELEKLVTEVVWIKE